MVMKSDVDSCGCARIFGKWFCGCGKFNQDHGKERKQVANIEILVYNLITSRMCEYKLSIALTKGTRGIKWHIVM